MEHFERVVLTAASTMNLAPMLAVLFIAARMRALHMDPVWGYTQPTVEACFYMTTGAMILQMCLALAVPTLLGGKVSAGHAPGDVMFEVKSKVLATVLLLVRIVAMLLVNAGVACTIFAIVSIQHPMGWGYTPPISTTVQCIIVMSIQFFLVYFLFWAFWIVNEFHGGSNSSAVQQALESAQAAVHFCPMLAILFLTARLRALHLGTKAHPQFWVNEAMYIATWALTWQIVLSIALPLIA